MATTDDNDNQGSSTREEIQADDIVNENSPCNAESPAEDTVGMATDDQDTLLPLNLSGSRSESPVPALDNRTEDANSQSSQCIENSSVEDIQVGDEKRSMMEDEKDGDTCPVKLASVSEGSVVSSQEQTTENNITFPSEDDNSQSSVCKGNNSIEDAQNNEVEMGVRKEEEDGTSAMVGSASEETVVFSQNQTSEHKQIFPEEDDSSQNSQCKENSSTKDAHDAAANMTIREEEREDAINLTSISEGSVASQDQMTEQDLPFLRGDDDTSKAEKEDCEDRSAASTPQFTAILNSEDSCDQNSRSPIPQTSSSVRADGRPVETVISDQDSQDSLADEPPMLISSDAECYIRLDEETFKEWNETRRRMRFGSDAQMAKFMMRRLTVHEFTETQSDSQESLQGRSKSQDLEWSTGKQSDTQKKKGTPTGGIESIVRRLHQVRTETDDTSPSQPDSDNDNVDSHFTDLIKIKTEPEEMCNSSAENLASASIPKKATTAIYSSGRNGRKRIYVKREPDVDLWGQNQQESPHSNFGSCEPDEQQSDMTSNDHYWPMRIKQEPMDTSESQRMATDQSTGDEKPRTLGQFVRNAASWVSHLVATELEKPQETATDVPDTPESLFSDSRLHKIIEQQLSKSPEPSVSEMRLQSVIENQLKAPAPDVNASFHGIQIKQEYGSAEDKLHAQSKAVKKELKRARREARHAKKLKKAQKRDKSLPKYSDPNQSSSPFERSSSEVSISPFEKPISPYEKSSSPYEKSPNQESVSASHCLESFARMVQIREFQGSPRTPSSSELQKSPQVQRLSPVPTNFGLHSPIPLTTAYSPQAQNSSPAPNTSSVLSNDSAPLPASLALKSFAQRSVTFEMEDDRGTPPHQETPSGWERSSPRLNNQIDAELQSSDPLTGSPLEKLLKVSETAHHNTAKSQLEHLLKAKDIKDKWSRPSVYSGQQVPHHVAQAHTSYSPHILNIPKVTFSGRSINDTSPDSFLKAPAIDRILASTGFSSDSEDSDAKEAKEVKDRNKDPDWSPARRKRPRKRSFPKNTDHGIGAQSSTVFSQFGDSVTSAVDKENGEPVEKVGYEPEVKHHRIETDGGGDRTTELTATSTLAKLLQMANKNNQGSSKPNSAPSTPKHGANVRSNEERLQTYESPKRDFTAKQSAFGAMQAFAQLVEIQGKTPAGQLSQQQSHIDEPLRTSIGSKLSDSLPSIAPDGMQDQNSSKLSDSLPSIGPGDMQGQNMIVGRGTHSPDGLNGARFRGNVEESSEVNGRETYDNDEPQDLTIHSNVRIKIEPQDIGSSIQAPRMARQVAKRQHHVNLLRKQTMQYTCSLCNQVFHSKSEVTEHKLRIHYSSGIEMVS